MSHQILQGMYQEGDSGEGPAHFPMQIFKELPLEPTLSDLVVLSYEGERNEEDDRSSLKNGNELIIAMPIQLKPLDLWLRRFEGYGIARFRSGDEYAGNFHLGLMEGQGKYTWEDGTVFEGEFHSNEVCSGETNLWKSVCASIVKPCLLCDRSKAAGFTPGRTRAHTPARCGRVFGMGVASSWQREGSQSMRASGRPGNGTARAHCGMMRRARATTRSVGFRHALPRICAAPQHTGRPWH
jgi:hypothetical protein